MKHRAGLKKLHEEGRLQRMLGIPPKTTDVHPFLTHYAQTSSSTSMKRPSDMPTPHGQSKRQKSDEVGAIVVDDDEVDQSDSDSESDEQDMDLEDDPPVVEHFPNGKGGVKRVEKNRFNSVSEDEEIVDFIESKEEEESETRYGMKRKPIKPIRPLQSVDVQGSASDSDDSIVAFDTPQTKTVKRGPKRVNSADRQAFWRAKAQPTVYVVSDSDS